jgi:hypothetical protein
VRKGEGRTLFTVYLASANDCNSERKLVGFMGDKLKCLGDERMKVERSPCWSTSSTSWKERGDCSDWMGVAPAFFPEQHIIRELTTA